ncbi:hypothetical protein Mnod_6837 [Methylobacterium nodulans ORS 2060]|uniref:DUF4113 domain-containing protein n=1 Tax=Methylobacterium nodulans (strain LMG 21967 / CNCM I-2342 / ORS 2060) TaxID=460265 RepID=B8IGB2_METNO|nr:hypothetical protein Mnod_6837 [Methylobacterium nodulans ORS 2060]
MAITKLAAEVAARHVKKTTENLPRGLSPARRSSHLPEATSDSLVLIKAALHGVAKTWREQGPEPWRYSKAGVVTADLVPLVESPRALFGALDRERSGALIAAMDACNRRFGRGTVVPARARLEAKRTWATKCEMRTPRYTTRLDELPVVNAVPV